MEILQFLMGLLVVLGLLGVRSSFANESKKTWRISSSVMTFVFVLLFISTFYSEVLFMGSMISGVGLLLMFLCIVNIKKIYNCSRKVDAVVTNVKNYTLKSSAYNSINIEYKFNEKVYRNQSFQEKINKKKYEKGDTIQVYINPQNPACFINKRMIGLVDIIMILVASSFFSVGIFVLNQFFFLIIWVLKY